jgi:hypothetical protein
VADESFADLFDDPTRAELTKLQRAATVAQARDLGINAARIRLQELQAGRSRLEDDA